MRKWRWTVPLMLVLASAPAAALEAGDLVIGVGSSLQTVDPQSGALEVLSEDLEPGAVTGIAVRPDGVVFFSQTSFLTATADVWRLDPRSGELAVFASPGPGIGGLGMDRQRRLVVAVTDSGRSPGAQPELIWLDSESGEEVLAIPLPASVLGVNDVAVDPEGRALLSTSRSGVLRVDPRTGGLEWVGARSPFALGTETIAAEADGSILATTRCLVPLPRPVPPIIPTPLPTTCNASLLRFDPLTAVPQSVSFIEGQPTGMAVEATGGIVVSVVPGFNAFGASRVLRVDPEDGSQTLVVDDLAPTGAIAVVPRSEPRIEVRPARVRVGRGGGGMLRVVLFGSPLLDVREVARDSLAFGPDGAPPAWSRILRRGRGAFADLLLLFRVDRTGLRPGDTLACLTGSAGGVDFQACDAVRVFGTLPSTSLSAGDLVVSAGASLFVVDPLSGEVELLSADPSFGPLPAGEVTGIAVAPGGRELFFTLQAFGAGFGSVWRVDPESGGRSLVAGGDFAGFLSPAGVVLEPAGSLLVVDTAALSRVDPASGAVEVVARLDGLPAGLVPSGLAMDGVGNALISTRNIFSGLSAVLQVDLASGQVGELVDDLLELTGVAVEADGSVLVTSKPVLRAIVPPGPLPAQPGRSVIRIDPRTGTSSLVSHEGLLMVPDGLAVETDGHIAVIDGGGPTAPDAVLRIDPRSGDQSLLAEIPALSDASAIAVVPPEPRSPPGRRGPPPWARPPPIR